MDEQLKTQEKELSDDITSLNKKVCSATKIFELETYNVFTQV